MFERAVLVIILAALCCLSYRLYTRQQLRRVQQDPILRALKPNVPTIVYFTTPHCMPCKTMQKPALARLQAELGNERLHIIEIDATQQPELASQWGVLSAPTTFVFDAQGKPSAVNHGAADLHLLKKQLSLPTSA